MATLDTLAPQSRAIIELLLRQDQSYDDLAGMLDMPSARVRELAREALGSLAPATARRVDDDWREQVADYVLLQQTGPEARATRGHLKHSEPARAGVASLLDSLDHLYADGQRPDIPEPDGGRASAAPRRRGTRGAAVGAGAAGAAGAAGRDRSAEREDGGAAAAPAEAGGARTSPAATEAEPARTGTATLSPEARAAVRRRRIAAAIGALGLVAAIVLAIVLIGGDEEGDERGSQPGSTQQAQGQPQARLVGQAPMKPVGESDAQGVGVIAERGGQSQLLVQAQGLRPSGEESAYEVWLYNSRGDAISLGGQVTDEQGNLQGAGPLPPNYRSYRFVDISREQLDRNPKHSGNSILRVSISDLLRGGAVARSGQSGVGSQPQPQPSVPERLRQKLLGVHDPGGVEASLQRSEGLEPELADLGGDPREVSGSDRVVMGDRAAGGDDRLARRRLRGAPLLDLRAPLLAREHRKVERRPGAV
jgi:hypothetical protein